MITSISLFEIIRVVQKLGIFFWIAASVADDDALNPSGLNFRVTSVVFFVADFDLLSCGFDNFIFKLILSHFILIIY